jgi:Tfp pilus assembly protein PilX
MAPSKQFVHLKRQGSVLLISMIFIIVFSALAVSMATLSGTNVQLASNQHKVDSALSAAQSGLECGKYIVATATLDKTGHNYVTNTEANKVWTDLCTYLQNKALDGKVVPSATRFTDSAGSGDQIITSSINFGSANTAFTMRFYRYDSNSLTIKLQATGTCGEATRQVGIDLKVTKDSKVLSYAIASRGRMWLTGSTTVHGDIFSTWNRPAISPFNMTSDSTVLGTINTVLTLQQIQDNGYQLETLDENGNPIFDENGNRVYSPQDQIQGYHEGINYGQPSQNMPGMSIADYDTSMYRSMTTSIPTTTVKRTEYFPHMAGDYTKPSDSGSRQLNRYVYENQTFTNKLLPSNRNALFKNCTFEEVLYIDCAKNTSTYYNNVRFENCTFNGTIITDVPNQLKWQNNCLYFTGEAAFNNTSSIQEATILAPHFNVNLGNTNPVQSDNNVLTGAIVGGIVDIRGNAQIYGTIISMCDTTQWTSGYVTNIGATLDDGGSETTEVGDVGVISITPEEDKMLPSGITSPIVIKPLQDTYSEG